VSVGPNVNGFKLGWSGLGGPDGLGGFPDFTAGVGNASAATDQWLLDADGNAILDGSGNRIIVSNPRSSPSPSQPA